MKIGILTPVLNEESTIRAFVEAIDRVLVDFDGDIEIIFVDDGSTDQTWEVIKAVQSQKCKVRGVKFTRNFGKEAALAAALEATSADAAILMDVDLQHPPEMIPQMIDLWSMGQGQVIECVKKKHETKSEWRRVFTSLFYRLFLFLGKIDIEKSSDFKLLDRKVIDAYLRFPEKRLFFRGLVSWLGFKTHQIEFEVQDRTSGITKWSPSKLIFYALDNIISFSSRPLKIIGYFGVVSLLISLFLSAQTLWMKYSGRATDGFTTVIILILFFGGIHLASIGLLAEYVARIFDEVKNRPRYIIEERV